MKDFMQLKKAVKDQFGVMTKGGNPLFVTNTDKNILWDVYLDSFPEGTNEIYRERRTYDCNCCKQFIRTIGNVVSIKDNKLVSIWDVEAPYPFDVVTKEMSKLVKRNAVKDTFMSKVDYCGTDKNRELLDTGKVQVWDHFHVNIPSTYVNNGTESIESIKGIHRSSKEVFMRSMEELTINAGNTILELIEQGSLYRGAEFTSTIKKFISYKTSFDKLKEDEKDNWCWFHSINNPVSRIRNTAIGTLLVDISNDVVIDTAVTKFEKIMAPTNYKRPNAIFTKKMVEEAQNKIEDLGLADSLGRKYAVLSDITVDNVLFVDRKAKKQIGGSVFDDLKTDIPENSKSFDKVEEVGVDEFITKILPKSSSIELMAEGKHEANLMSLIAPTDKNAPSILKWSNNFSWSYNGNITDSMIRENVKSAGGKVDGVLRFSIQWNDEGDNNLDFDAHCIEPTGNEIYYSRKRSPRSGGNLDVDIITPNKKVAVENITWPTLHKMEEGRYRFFVHNYSSTTSTRGFTAEIEYNGEVYSYCYDKPLRGRNKIDVALVDFNRATGIKFVKSLDSSVKSKNIWGLSTNKFSKVSVVMHSPNYWDGQVGIGNKHYFFLFDDCKNEEMPRGFYNEFLNDKLLTHKRVFEALGSKMRVPDSEEQLSGLGFSSTQRNSIVAKVEGSFSRMIKIIF